MVDQPGAIPMWVPTGITFDFTDATWVVIHKTAGFQTAQDCAAYFQSGSGGNNVSAHYVVGLDGTIVQCVPESRGAGANCCLNTGHADFLPTNINLNIKTISIEHIDPRSDNGTTCPPAQKAASFKLIHDICKRHNIPMRRGDASGGVIGHNQIDPINRARCPGNYPWDELLNYLNNGGQDDMLTSSDDFAKRYFDFPSANEWRCKVNGVRLGDTYLKYYQAINGAPRLPLTAVHSYKTPKGTIGWQRFESGIMIYDPHAYLDGPSVPGGNGCYMLKEDSDLARHLLSQDLLDKITALQAQVDSLNQQLASTQNANVQALQQQIQDLTTQLTDAKSALSQIQSLAATAASK